MKTESSKELQGVIFRSMVLDNRLPRIDQQTKKLIVSADASCALKYVSTNASYTEWLQACFRHEAFLAFCQMLHLHDIFVSIENLNRDTRAIRSNYLDGKEKRCSPGRARYTMIDKMYRSPIGRPRLSPQSDLPDSEAPSPTVAVLKSVPRTKCRPMSIYLCHAILIDYQKNIQTINLFLGLYAPICHASSV